MHIQYSVIGPVGGYYHVGYFANSGVFFSAHEFVSNDLAHLTAYRMNQTLEVGVRNGG